MIHRAFASALFFLVANVTVADDPLLRPDDRLALLGGTFIERMQTSGALEAELQCRRPDWHLKVRNIGWSGDDVHGIARKRFDSPEDGFQRLLQDVQTADPTVVLVAYGFSEASDGAEAVKRFEPGLRRLIAELKQQQRRIVLMTPLPMPGFRVENYGRWVAQCRKTVAAVAAETNVEVLSPAWKPSSDQLTEDQLLPSEQGYADLAESMADSLVGPADCEPTLELKQLIAAKNQLFFHRYRPQNETYLLLFRKHEQGNNAVEIPQFDPLIQQADEKIWAEVGHAPHDTN